MRRAVKAWHNDGIHTTLQKPRVGVQCNLIWLKYHRTLSPKLFFSTPGRTGGWQSWLLGASRKPLSVFVVSRSWLKHCVFPQHPKKDERGACLPFFHQGACLEAAPTCLPTGSQLHTLPSPGPGGWMALIVPFPMQEPSWGLL